MKFTHSFEQQCLRFLKTSDYDSAHDIAHITRVVKSAKQLSQEESADDEVIVAAAWLHDCVILPKDHPERKTASTLAAKKAMEFLSETDYPDQKTGAVSHAIEAHSYSARIPPKTIEAKIVQDADRLDALGAVGIARCFLVGGSMGTNLYHPDDPFCENRQPDDRSWTIDHFYSKLFKLPATMNTDSGKAEAKKRVDFMKAYLNKLSQEIK